MKEFEVNIFDWLEKRCGRFHSVAITTYSFDPIFFVHYIYPRLKKLGVYNVVLMVDRGIYDQMMVKMNDFVKEAIIRLHISIVRMDKGCKAFHSKVMFFTGDTLGAICLGSGNMTFSGMSLNREAWGILSVDKDDMTLSPILCRAWEYVQSLCWDKSELLKEQLSWFSHYSEWLSQAVASDEWVVINKDERVRLLFNSKETSIYKEWMKTIKGRQVQSLCVISPFYDKAGKALELLINKLSPKSVRVYIDINYGILPVGLIEKDLDNVAYIAWTNSESSQRFHCKMYQVNFQDGTSQLLLGSSNASVSGLRCFDGDYNEEACFLLESKLSMKYAQQLGFDDSIKPLNPSELKVVVEQAKFDSDESNILTKKQLHRISICCAEYDGEKLFLSFGVPLDEDNYYLLLDDKKKVSLVEYVGMDKVIITCSGIQHHASVVVCQNNQLVSNILLVTCIESIQSGNPNPAINKVKGMLNRFETGEDNLDDLLDYVYEFEIDVKHLAKKITYSTSCKDDEETIMEKYTRDDFENSGVRLNLSKKHPTIGIADFLNTMSSNIHLERDEDVNVFSDNIGAEDIDPTLYRNDYDLDEGKKDEKIYKALKRYIINVTRFIDHKMSAVFSHVREEKNLFISSKEREYECQFNDIILTVVGLRSVKRYLKKEQSATILKKYDEDFRDYIVELCNSFILLILSGKYGVPKLYDSKAKEYIGDICRLTAIVLAYFNYSRKDKEYIGLVTLNLLEVAKRYNCLGVVLDELYKNNQLMMRRNKDVMLLVYEQFKKKPINSLVADLKYADVIVYKQSFGFFRARHFEASGDMYLVKVYHPSINPDEDIEILCGSSLMVVDNVDEEWQN